MVAHPFRSVSSTPGGAIAESGSSHDDSLLVRQQLLRSVDRRGCCALPHRRATALQQFPKRWHFLRRGGVHRPFFIVVFGCGLCAMESLGPRRLLGTLPNTICFKRSGRAHGNAHDCDLGDDWDCVAEKDTTLVSPGGERSLPRFALR